MALPAPNLDDRRFQDLVDDAKRMLQRKWPEWSGWTDHNVSDPGVTLIETFAFMVDQMLYRLNRVPDRNYVKFLELIGLQLQPPTAATAPVTFWLSAPQGHDVLVPEGTEVQTERSELVDPVVFRTRTDATAVSVRRTAVVSAPTESTQSQAADLTDALDTGSEVAIFAPRPEPGNCLYVGLSAPAPGCAVVVRVDGDVEGYGINPDRPPVRWEAWNGALWALCTIERDQTGGFNRAGDIVLHVPTGHRISTVGGRRAAWLRCVVTPPSRLGDAVYGASPRVDRIEAFTMGVTVDAIHGETVRNEPLGTAEGVAGQQFQLERFPVVLSNQPEVLEVVVDTVDDSGRTTEVQEWSRVDTFARCGPNDRCFVLEPSAGIVRMPVAVREADGSARHFGAVPPTGAHVRMRCYRCGGGRIGNVAAGTLRSIRTSLPLVASAVNRHAAVGGVDGESIEDAKVRGPLMLRTRERAVTSADFEHLALSAAPEIARVRCTDASASDPGSVRVLLVPRVAETDDRPGRIELHQLRPRDETFARIADALDERRVIGVRVVVELPSYHGVRVVARLRARRRARAAEVEREALASLYGYFHPVDGGPDGRGWPFGRPIQAGEVHAVLQRVLGVDFVEEAMLFAYDVDSGQLSARPTDRIDVPLNGLVFSHAHQVDVEEQT